MTILDNLTNNPQTANTTATATQQTLPAWYTDFLQNMAGRGIDIANRGYTPYEGARVAGLSPLQQAAITMVQNGAGSEAPWLTQAQSAITGALGQLGAAGTPRTWPGAAQEYMSPYTSRVVDDIARRGNQNFNERLLPSIQASFAANGQFGSTRFADAATRAARDVQDNISGTQANALESGYRSSADIFGADANRAMTGGLQSAQIGLGAGQQLGALGQMSQNLRIGDANALTGLGGLQQQNQQLGLNTAYTDWQTQQGWDMNQLNQLRGLISGMQLPGGATSVSNAPGTPQASPLQWIGSFINQIPQGGLFPQQQPGAAAGTNVGNTLGDRP